MRWMKQWTASLSALAALLWLVVACNRLNPQADAESKFALEVITWMKLHDVELAHVPVTNMIQLFPLVRHGYPYWEHHRLVNYGRHAGFTNSLAEKCVFFWPRFTHKYIEGEVLCMSAQPFPWDKELRRIYIARSGSNYIYRSIGESRVQTIFRELKPVSVPLGEVKPPPEPPTEVAERLRTSPRQHFDKLTRNVADALGQDSTSGARFILLFGFGGIALLLVLFLFIWVGRRGRH